MHVLGECHYCRGEGEVNLQRILPSVYHFDQLHTLRYCYSTAQSYLRCRILQTLHLNKKNVIHVSKVYKTVMYDDELICEDLMGES